MLLRRWSSSAALSVQSRMLGPNALFARIFAVPRTKVKQAARAIRYTGFWLYLKSSACQAQGAVAQFLLALLRSNTFLH
jgi:hypothetical protein